jgi:hypothetical protein
MRRRSRRLIVSSRLACCLSGSDAESHLLPRSDFEHHGRWLSPAPRNLTYMGGHADERSSTGGEEATDRSRREANRNSRPQAVTGSHEGHAGNQTLEAQAARGKPWRDGYADARQYDNCHFSLEKFVSPAICRPQRSVTVKKPCTCRPSALTCSCTCPYRESRMTIRDFSARAT